MKEEIARIKLPTLVVAGKEDVATTPVATEAAISCSNLVRIPLAERGSSMDGPAAGSRTISEFSAGVSNADIAWRTRGAVICLKSLR